MQCLYGQGQLPAQAVSPDADADLGRSCPSQLQRSFFFKDTAPPEISTLSLHDALPICSDTEVILHLLARSSERTLAGALRDALLQLEGAFSLVFLAEDRIILARDPHGFRPLAVGEMEISGGRKCHVAASETCAFDLIGAARPGSGR